MLHAGLRSQQGHAMGLLMDEELPLHACMALEEPSCPPHAPELKLHELTQG